MAGLQRAPHFHLNKLRDLCSRLDPVPWQKCTMTILPGLQLHCRRAYTVSICHYLGDPANGASAAAAVLLFPSFNYPHSFWEGGAARGFSLVSVAAGAVQGLCRVQSASSFRTPPPLHSVHDALKAGWVFKGHSYSFCQGVIALGSVLLLYFRYPS